MITLDDVQAARARLDGVAFHTPPIALPRRKNEPHVWFKPENLQPIGAFKIRGAYNRIAAIPEAQRAAGVIAYSSGNHAQGVAYAARLLNIPAVIVMPNNAPAVKIAATRAYGANVVLYDPATESREVVAARLMEGKAWTLVPPFNDPYVIAGQGIIGLEIFEDLPEVDLILVPVGGGGLISGIAAAIKSLKPSVRVIGVEPELANDAQRSLHDGHIVTITQAEAVRTIADGVRTLSVGDLTLAHLQRFVDDILTVNEAEIRKATRRLILRSKLVAEPAGALPFAAYLYHRDQLPQARTIVLIVSGGNIDPALLAQLIRR
ncbi:MAG TPA: threonine/serine dehydratase [Aggregatilineales bacterium]|nr:threonine/serine dehydratase [Aggregatilineales bacterium]